MASALLVGCGGGADRATTEDLDDLIVEPLGVRLVSPGEAADLARDGVTILDIRTPEEFAAGHLDGAMMIDFYAPDFAASLANLERGATYVLYCRSGNRSAQAADLMTQLSFTDVAEIDGGVLAWSAAGLPLATG